MCRPRLYLRGTVAFLDFGTAKGDESESATSQAEAQDDSMPGCATSSAEAHPVEELDGDQSRPNR